MVNPIDADTPKPTAPDPASDPGPRFLCMDLPGKPGLTVTLDKDQANHATRVLRLSEGSRVQLIDGQGMIAHATLTSAGPRATCTIRVIKYAPAPSLRIELATAIPKGPRADAMVNDLAQLGADWLIPLHTQRSVVHPRASKRDRLAKAAAEAAKQSGRNWFMQINDTSPFADELDCDADLKLIADPHAQPITDLPARLASASTVRVLIGPEGGFTEEERSAACQAGFTPWRFSPHTLRIETAAIAAVAILRAQA